MLPNAGIETAPGGVRRFVPEITICVTLVALGSFTAHEPVSVARGLMALSPVQSWQLTQAPSNTILPRASGVPPPSRWDAGAGGASVAGRSGEAIAGTVRRQETIARMSSGSRLLKLQSAASPIGPEAVPWPAACPIDR